MQKPDIGAMIFHHTGDTHVIELPFIGEKTLPGPWYIPGTHIDVSPTKHVVFMLLAAFLVWLTIWWGGRQVDRRHREGGSSRSRRQGQGHSVEVAGEGAADGGRRANGSELHLDASRLGSGR